MDKKILQGEIGKHIKLEHFMNDAPMLLNSPGGDLFTGFSIYDYNVANNIDIGVVGVCGSAATIALLGSSTRWGTPNSRYLIHNPSGEVKGDAKEMEDKAELLRNEENKILNIYETHLNGTRDDIRAWMNENKLWDANTALERGLITEIRNISEKAEQPEGTDINNIFNNFKMSINMEKKDSEKLSGIQSTLDSLASNIKALFKPKNVIVQDVNGTELDFYDTETAEQIAVDQMANVDGSPASGDYTMASGEVYVFDAGNLTEIKPAEGGEDVDALKAENADLKQQLADVQNKVTKKETEVTGLKNSLTTMGDQVTNVSNELKEFKNKFSEEKPKANTPPDANGGRTKFNYKK